MRFRFCGGLDCPDWILAEIALLAKLTSIKFRILCQIICQGIVNGKFQDDKAEKILVDAGLCDKETTGCLSALTFIVKSSTKYGCDSASLNNELQQLGLPSELAHQICKVYDDQQSNIKAALEKSSFKLNGLVETNGTIAETEDGMRFAQLQLKFDNPQSSSATVAISNQKLELLAKEIAEAVGIMERLGTS